MNCPLCAADNHYEYCRDKRRQYRQCEVCALVFVVPSQRLSKAAEKAEYDKHQNDPSDTAYRNFLSRLSEPLQDYVAPHARGLDFGCGPGPTLSVMLEEYGYKMQNYDIFYADDSRLLECEYDFITATEVVEHLFNPSEVLQALWGLLPKGGVLALMTKLVRGQQAFVTWHYKNDLTHVCFFSEETFRYLALRFNAELNIIGQDVIILKKLSE